MPFVSDAERLLLVGEVSDLPTEEQIDLSMLDVLPAAFRVENPVGAAMQLTPLTPVAEREPEHDPFSVIQGTPSEDYPEAFIHSGSAAETAAIMRAIDAELEDRRLLHAAGWPGVAASMVAGVLDPINFVPVGGVAYRATRVGSSVLQGAARTAAAGFIGAGASEMALHSLQQTRTVGESAANVAASTLLSGVLGGAAAGLSKREYAKLVKAVEERNATVVLCRDGRAVAEIRRLARRRTARNLRPDSRFRVELAPGYRPAEPLTDDEWPDTLR